MAEKPVSAEKLRLVNHHLTPLAAIIVVPGLIVVPLPSLVVVAGALLVGCTVSINYLSIYLAKQHAPLIKKVRVGTNYTANIVLLWLLYSTWPPVWMLLLLMSIGVAVYQNRRDSLLAGFALVTLLLAVHWVFGEHSLRDWAVVGVEGSLIVMANLFVNGLSGVAPEIPETLSEEQV